MDSCACTGVKLTKRLIQGYSRIYDNPLMTGRIVPSLQKVAAELYEHITEQARDNEALRQEGSKYLKQMQDALDSASPTSMLGVDAVKDALHKSPAVRILTLCGDKTDELEAAESLLNYAMQIAGGDIWENEYDHKDGRKTPDDAILEIDKIINLLQCDRI